MANLFDFSKAFTCIEENFAVKKGTLLDEQRLYTEKLLDA
jgi:hypothetical protein